MQRVSRKLILVVVASLVLYVLISKLRIVVLVHVSLWQALLIVAIIVGILFLGLDHLLNRDRSSSEDAS